MKMMKRTLLSMKRRPYQMVLMFLIVFILGNVLFASIAVKQSSEAVKAEMRRRIPSNITIELKNSGYSFDNIDVSSMNKFIEDMEKNENITEIAYMELVDQNINMSDVISGGTKYSYGYLYSMRESNDLYSQFKIVEGRNYTPEDFTSDQPKVVLSNLSTLEIGDTFDLDIHDVEVLQREDEYQQQYLAVNYDTITFEVIGKYDAKDLSQKYEQQSFGFSLFIPEKWANQVLEAKEKMWKNHSKEDREIMKNNLALINNFFNSSSKISLVSLNVNGGIDAVEQLEEEIKANSNYVNSQYSLKSSTSDYRFIEGPLENLVALADVAMIASIVLTIVLLGLVSMMFMRMRKHEIGIFMALGERKYKVLGQYVCEIILIGLLAATCAIYSGNKMGSMISNEFIKIQVDADSEMKYQEQGEITQLDMMEAYEVKLDGEYIASIYGATFVILLLSSAVPVLFILRTKPKEVLM